MEKNSSWYLFTIRTALIIMTALFFTACPPPGGSSNGPVTHNWSSEDGSLSLTITESAAGDRAVIAGDSFVLKNNDLEIAMGIVDGPISSDNIYDLTASDDTTIRAKVGTYLELISASGGSGSVAVVVNTAAAAAGTVFPENKAEAGAEIDSVTVSPATAMIGDTLYASVTAGGKLVTGTINYKWYRKATGGEKTEIIGATAYSYKVVEADAGKEITVEVSNADTTAPVASAAVTVLAADTKKITAITVNGSFKPVQGEAFATPERDELITTTPAGGLGIPYIAIPGSVSRYYVWMTSSGRSVPTKAAAGTRYILRLTANLESGYIPANTMTVSATGMDNTFSGNVSGIQFYQGYSIHYDENSGKVFINIAYPEIAAEDDEEGGNGGTPSVYGTWYGEHDGEQFLLTISSSNCSITNSGGIMPYGCSVSGNTVTLLQSGYGGSGSYEVGNFTFSLSGEQLTITSHTGSGGLLISYGSPYSSSLGGGNGGGVGENSGDGEYLGISGFTFTPVEGLQVGLETVVDVYTIVGSFSNPVGASENHRWSLVSGEGSTDNELFFIENGDLVVGNTALTEAKTYSVRVKVADSSGWAFVKACQFTVASLPPRIQVGDEKLTILWEPVPGASGYRIYTSTKSSNREEAAFETETSSQARSFVLEPLTNYTLYYVWIESVTDGIASAMGGRLSGTPIPAQDIPVYITIPYSSEWTLFSNATATVETTLTETFTVAEPGYTDGYSYSLTDSIFQWYLDGVLQPGETNKSYGFSAITTKSTVGDTFELVVVVTNNNGEKRSGRITITIVPKSEAN
ncbi:MAG: hypothetical protein LBM77_06370 [Spirochaetaceae bacterium]|jgi:hypothetical protein|nr:hypothetical protein [Spirochaetaceae bacterium]